MSRIRTFAPSPAATLAAFEPTTPPPRIATSAGATPGHARQQDPAPFLGPFQVLRPLLDAHPAGDLAHRRQQGQVPLRVAERLVGDGRDPAVDHRPGQGLVGGEVEVGEDDLAGPQHAATPTAAAP